MTTYRVSNSKNHRTRAFTLIEMLVAAAMFTAIITLTVGAFTQSISFGSASSEDRVTRQVARSFVDMITRQVRQVNSTQFTIKASDYCSNADSTGTIVATCPPAVTTDYTGSGFILLANYYASSKYYVMDYSNIGAQGLIIPIVDPTYKWMYIGPCSSTTPVIRRTSKAILAPNGSGGADDFCGGNWVDIGQFVSPDAVIQNLRFFGVAPKSVVYASNGSITSYGTAIQPFLSVVISLAPKTNPTNITTYTTTISSRDFQFSFPRCSAFATTGCI